MNHHSAAKSDVKSTASVAASATFSHEIDCAGFKYASIDVVYSPFTATTAAYASVLKIQESDASGSGQADVSGMSVTAGSGSTSVATVARFNIDLRGRKRYLTVVTSPGNTVAITSDCRLGKAENHASSAATANVNDYKSL
jgi:hypothetical protein